MTHSLSKIQFLLLLCLFFACRQTGIELTDDIAVIDVINNLGKYREIPVSELVTEFEYIPLETNDNCLIGAVYRMLVTSSHIFIQGYVGGGSPGVILPGGATRCYAFGRDGRFLCEIGRVGQGPGEYQNIAGLCVDENNQLLYIESHLTLLEYTWEGVFRRSIRKPQNLDEYPGSEINFVRDNLFIGHFQNHRGNEPVNFILFNDSGRVIKTFDNHIKFERTDNWVSIYDRSMRSFRVSENIFVKEYPNDTLFCLNERNELIPQFVFNLGKYSFSNEKRGGGINEIRNIMSNILMIPDALFPMIGTPNYIFFSIMVSNADIPSPKVVKSAQYIQFGLYDIVNKKTLLLENDPVSRMSGLINDIDGGFSFWPKYYSLSHELADVYQAYEMKEILKEKYFAGRTIKNPQAHQKLKELVNNLKEDDNPVIVIAKLKQ